MPCHCCNKPPPKLHTPQGRSGRLLCWEDSSYPEEVLPGVVVDFYYQSMTDWELAIARQRWPNNPYLYVEYARRTPGHLKGSSRNGQLLDNQPILRKFLCSDKGPGEDASISKTKNGKSSIKMATSSVKEALASKPKDPRSTMTQSKAATQATGLSKRTFS
ncbi:hypothetical protein ONS95_007295 [Cadophora gregata]|uniref:uncharacterized protein n=1 Tax=Cadophora gregata TaxID=51156 RepID=UPI0026DD015D|nr:uncharacterized protein ONS95_007295 [Cadophora gregata]KAK0100848.1 hypothetical protein ONS95_007295 [Cadophora gregata]KAK0117159.1 hypothetical protein ONS96_012993 [Cadophora gregata f. sp. sojae]